MLVAGVVVALFFGFWLVLLVSVLVGLVVICCRFGFVVVLVVFDWLFIWLLDSHIWFEFGFVVWCFVCCVWFGVLTLLWVGYLLI